MRGIELAFAVFLSFVALGAPASADSGLFREPRFRVATTADVVYGVAPTRNGPFELRADLYEPVDGPALRPAFVVIHGGGFTDGDKALPQWVQTCRALAQRGFVCLSIDYRLQGDAPSTPGLTPRARAIAAAVEDASTAVRWVDGEADRLQVDRTRIAIGGGSAGATTAMLAAYGDRSLPIRAVFDGWGSLGRQTSLITPGAPPILIVHGTDDPLVPFADAEAIFARATAVGVVAELVPIVGGGHGVAPNQPIDGTSLIDRLADFLYRHLDLASLSG